MLNQNPYHPLSPPDDPTLFYGRQNAIAFLRQHFVGADNHAILVILGRIGMGKTSLLLYLRKHYLDIEQEIPEFTAYNDECFAII